jgi:hypothetical protein
MGQVGVDLARNQKEFTRSDFHLPVAIPLISTEK